MTPGIYKAEWSGQGGRSYGGGLLVLMHNTIAGADVFGVTFDGEYAFDGQGEIVVRWLKAKVPPGVALAQGGAPQQVGYVLDIPPFSLDMNNNESVFQIQTTPTPLAVKLKLIRRLEL
jgi:hypothetical protein